MSLTFEPNEANYPQWRLKSYTDKYPTLIRDGRQFEEQYDISIIN